MKSGSGRATFLALLVATIVVVPACGKRIEADPNNREIPWRYGPTTGGATAEHVRGAGKEGGPAIAKGWQCRLQDGTKLVVRPYQPESSHPLFGKVVMSFALFDKAEQPITTLISDVVTADTMTFTFELAPEVAKRLWDMVIWYRKP